MLICIASPQLSQGWGLEDSVVSPKEVRAQTPENSYKGQILIFAMYSLQL